MAVTKEITCPHCKKALPFGEGFEHDEELNFICSHCRKVVFGITDSAEAEVKRTAGSSSSGTTMGFHGGHQRKEPLPIRLNTIPDPEEVAAAVATRPETGHSSHGCDDLEEYNCFI